MTARVRSLAQLPNLGQTVAARLTDAGIRSAQQLARVGPVRAYCRLCERTGRRLPACYYLYSLEGALRGIPWTALSTEDKRRLRREVDRAADMTRLRR